MTKIILLFIVYAIIHTKAQIDNVFIDKKWNNCALNWTVYKRRTRLGTKKNDQ